MPSSAGTNTNFSSRAFQSSGHISLKYKLALTPRVSCLVVVFAFFPALQTASFATAAKANPEPLKAGQGASSLHFWGQLQGLENKKITGHLSRFSMDGRITLPLVASLDHDAWEAVPPAHVHAHSMVNQPAVANGHWVDLFLLSVSSPALPWQCLPGSLSQA